MTYDPYQTFPAFGASSGLTNPFSSPYNTIQASAFNPAAAYNPIGNTSLPWGAGVGIQTAGLPGQGGISPQHLQLAAVLAAQAAQMSGISPFANPWQNSFVGNALQHQFANTGFQNPMLNPQLNPLLAQIAATQFNNPYASLYHQQQPYQQQQSYQQQQPYQQTGSPFNSPIAGLAPQSWVGPQGQGQGQIHPLVLQALAGALQNRGNSPWGGF